MVTETPFIASIDDRLEPIILLVNTDRPRGIEDLTRLAEDGDKSAIVFLGLYLGEELRTREESTKWLLLAAQFGSAQAAWNLAMDARERGDIQAMKDWIDRAADLGEEDAIEARSNGYDINAVLEKWR